MKNLFGEEITVRSTFPYNAESKTAPDTAMRWAAERRWNYKTNSYDDDGFVPQAVEWTKEPFEVTIIDLQVRSEGGRAYKVVDNESRLFDLREDQLLEALRMGGVQPGGKINGKFVWGVQGSQVRMVYVDGEMHKGMLEKLETNKEKDLIRANGGAPTPGTLKVGRVYKKRDESLHLFVGRVSTATSKKKLFAFAALPNPPYRHTDEVYNDLIERYSDSDRNKDYVERLRRDQDLAVRWDTMTWLERFESLRGSYYLPEIMLMSTPKFDSEESDNLEDVAAMLRANVNNDHRYVDGNRNNLAHARWLAKTGEDLDRYRPYPYPYTEAARQAHDKKLKDDTKNAYDQFKAELVWE